MKSWKIIFLGMMISGSLLLSGCVKLWTETVDIKTYMIETQRSASVQPAPLADKLWIDTVTVLPPSNVRNLLFRKNDVEFETSYYSELLLSPSENFRNEFYMWFAGSGIFRDVSLGDRRGMSHRLEISVLKFYGDDSQEPGHAVLQIKVTLLEEKGRGAVVLFSKNYAQQVALNDPSVEGLVRAYNQSLSTILSDCEADIVRALRQPASP
jgi:uncharacterized lipoprotein YmbA